VRSIFDGHGLVLFCSGWATLNCFESNLIEAWHISEIMGEGRGANK